MFLKCVYYAQYTVHTIYCSTRYMYAKYANPYVSLLIIFMYIHVCFNQLTGLILYCYCCAMSDWYVYLDKDCTVKVVHKSTIDTLQSQLRLRELKLLKAALSYGNRYSQDQ